MCVIIIIGKNVEKCMPILDNNTICKNYKIFIDTCSLLDDTVEDFFSNIKSDLVRNDNKIIIPYGVISELDKHQKNTVNTNLSKRAKRALRIIQKYLKNGKYLKIMGEENEQFADNVFQTVFTKFRLRYNLLLITQDNNLAKAILSLKNTPSVQYVKEIEVLRIDTKGTLESFFWQDQASQNIDKFKLCTSVTNISDTPISVKHIPVENDIISSVKHGSIRLIKRLGGGGEGDVYKTNTPYIAKIYKQGKLTSRKQKKLELMVTKKVEYEGICYPVDLLYEINEFVGYLMPEARGEVLQTSIFIKPRMMELFPNWKKRDIVEVAVEILKKIKYLHDRNIILGDINPMNIHIVNSKEIYFVDTDSYQIEDFPCPVGTVNYTAPELQGKKYEDYLRTFGNEYFAVATLLFMLMLPGKTPYAQQGGGSPTENIRGMDFPYPFGGTKGGVPEGPWRYCWSHLTYELKKAFYETFMKWENVPIELKKNNEKAIQNHASQNTRYDVTKWLDMFQRYQKLLDLGKFGDQDPMSEEIFPTRLKRIPQNKYSRTYS